MSVSVQTGDFDVSVELARLRDGNAGVGAVASFVGIVRDMSDGEAVFMMELEHYPGMTEKSLQQIVGEAKERWSVLAVRIIHRVGKLEPAEQVVLVAVAASHRADAFSACEFMMDCLKTRAPFWKKEVTASGSRWVDARASDAMAAKRWQKEDAA
jgi:Molybdopterin converting factor, large subunit